MSRIFVFGIGGTGSRVIRSLVMMLASGIRINADEVIPIIIDPDRANGDLNRTIEILRLYQEINKYAPSGEGFFSTKISSLSDNPASDENNPETGKFLFSVRDTSDSLFRDMLEFGKLDKPNKALSGLLFSKRNLDAEMQEGFKGNPNIGSVVLNQFSGSEDFKHFASCFRNNDKIFIISSIFGGTGAAGFPLLVKNIRNAPPELDNHQELRDATIGAITVLPYFGVSKDPQSQIDKSSFFGKTRAALEYYYRNITGNNSVNNIYYIGDQIMNDYPNHEGSLEQKNDAHLVEFASALAICDFLKYRDGNEKTVAKEFGITDCKGSVSFHNLSAGDRKLLENNLSSFYLFRLFILHRINQSVKQQPWARSGKAKIDAEFLRSGFYSSSLNPFLKHFSEWLTELASNKISFKPFYLPEEIVPEQLFEQLIVNRAPKEILDLPHRNFWKMESALNKASRDKRKETHQIRKFLVIFDQASRKTITKHFN